MKYFRIVVPMRFLGKLETALLAIGAEIMSAGPTVSGTRYKVTVTFSTTVVTQHQLTQFLWTQFPEVEVLPIGKKGFVPAEAVNWCGGVEAE